MAEDERKTAFLKIEDGFEKLIPSTATTCCCGVMKVTTRADNSRGSGGPMGPLCTPLRNPETLLSPSITHWKPVWDP
jgi:hypothetical protein